MKKLFFILGFGLIIGMININKADAQVHISINIDIQPAWGPSGYNYTEFYYIPEIDIYYDVIHQMFYYNNRGRWISSVFLPMAYRHYDFYSLYKVVLNGVFQPWKYNRRHVSLYAKYRNNYVQVPIFYMNEARYHRAKSNYHGWVEPRYMPRNNGRPVSRNFSTNARNGRINDSRPTAPDNRRDIVNNRSSRNDATINNRNNSSNNSRNTPAVRSNNSNRNNNASVRNSNSSSNNIRNNSNVNSRSNDTRSSNASVRSSNNDNKNSPAVSSRNNNSSKESSVRSSARNSENKSSSSTKDNGSNRQDARRAVRK